MQGSKDNMRADDPKPMAAPMRRVMRLWRLTPIDHHEPPFHFSNVPSMLIVAAEDERHARAVAMNEPGAGVWGDETRTMVEEMKPGAAMVIARDMGVRAP